MNAKINLLTFLFHSKISSLNLNRNGSSNDPRQSTLQSRKNRAMIIVEMLINVVFMTTESQLMKSSSIEFH